MMSVWDTDEHTLRDGDLVASRISDGTWQISLGESSGAVLGRVHPFGSWWFAIRSNGIVSADGYYWGEYTSPDFLGWGANPIEAMRHFA